MSRAKAGAHRCGSQYLHNGFRHKLGFGIHSNSSEETRALFQRLV